VFKHDFLINYTKKRGTIFSTARAYLNLISMETLSQVIFALNKMVDINGQRTNRYKVLAGKAKEIEIKLFFMQHAIQAQTFTATLNKWRNAYGATNYTQKKESGLSTTLYNIKKIIGGRNYELKECEEMEVNALKTYKTALALHFLPASTIEDIAKQTDELEKVHYSLKALRENGSRQWHTAFF